MKEFQLSPVQQSLGPEWSNVSKGGCTVKPQIKEVQQSEPIVETAKVTKVAKPRNLSSKRMTTPTQSNDSPLATINGLAKEFLSLLSLA